MKHKFNKGDTVFVQGEIKYIYEGGTEDCPPWYGVDFNIDGEEPILCVVEEISIHRVH